MIKKIIWQLNPYLGIGAGLFLSLGIMGIFLPTFPTAPLLVFQVVLLLTSILAGGGTGILSHYPLSKPQRITVPIILIIGQIVGQFIMLAISGQTTLINEEIPYTALSCVLIPVSYFIMRGSAAVWYWWERKRRERILYAMIHTHLLLSIGIGTLFFIVGLGWIGAIVWQDKEIWGQLANPGYSLFSAVLLWSLLLIMFSGAVFAVGLLIILPPSYLFSYWMAQHITTRIEVLDKAASALEMGDLTASTSVDGNDEIARLQRNFNTMAASIKDVTSALEDEKSRVSQLLNTQQRLSVNVSHELRTPIATLRAYIDSMLLHWNEQSPKSTKHDLEILSHEVEQLHTFVDDLLALNAVQVRKLSFNYINVSPDTVINHVVETLSPAIWHTSKVEVSVNLSNNLPPIRIDEQRFAQILKNLIFNGARHTPPGGFICIQAFEETDQVCVQIIDSGEGIKSELLPHIWEPFYKIDPSSSGMGLGLALVKEFTETMNGSVSVQSKPGKGTTFNIRFPINN